MKNPNKNAKARFGYVPSSCIKVMNLLEVLQTARVNEPQYKPTGVITQQVNCDWQVMPITFLAGLKEAKEENGALCLPLINFYNLTLHNLVKEVLMSFYECLGLEDARSNFLHDMTFSPDIGWHDIDGDDVPMDIPHHPFDPEEVLNVMEAFIEEGVYDVYLEHLNQKGK